MSDQPTTSGESIAHGNRRSVSLKNLYLDPNNFRIVDHPDYRRILPERELDADVQRRTATFVLGRNQDQVRDLIASIKENGWLDIDPLLVHSKGKGRYLVIEGNRRVATLKHLQIRHAEDSIDLGNLDSNRFSSLPVVVYDDADEHHRMIMMGLHHITGKRRWPAINRALAMKTLLDHFEDADAVCRALGVSKREFNLSIRTLALIEMYKARDYGDEFRSDKYNLFREVLRSPGMRKWLGWDESTRSVANQSNLDRLFAWMSKDVTLEEEDSQSDDSRPTPDAVITSAIQVRDLAKLIDDPDALSRLEETRSLQEAALSSEQLVKSEIERVLGALDAGIDKVTRRIGELKPENLDRVDQFIGRLQGVSLAHKRRPPTTGERLPWQPFNEITKSQFSSLCVDNYRGIGGIALEDLGRVNVIVGVNNAGKTSLLEAVYLLARQNDERALLDVLRWRSRIEGDPEPAWIADQLPDSVQVSGVFDAVDDNHASFTTNVVRVPDADIGDQTTFLTKLMVMSCYGSRAQRTETAFFSDRRRRTTFDGQHWLCRTAFTSPFYASRPAVLARSNKASLEAGTKAEVIDFIRNEIDSGLRNIELADRFNRFLVSHRDFATAPDRSWFGEGVRRVFEIGLLFAGVRGGVLLVDEFENAMHKDLFSGFTLIVQKLAVKLNVQVFLTTHSKEALDALLVNDYRTDDIACYVLGQENGDIAVRRFGGKQLRRLHEAVDFDVRGLR